MSIFPFPLCYLLPVILCGGKCNPFDGVVDVVILVLALEHHPEAPAAEALHRLEVGQESGCEPRARHVHAGDRLEARL